MAKPKGEKGNDKEKDSKTEPEATIPERVEPEGSDGEGDNGGNAEGGGKSDEGTDVGRKEGVKSDTVHRIDQPESDRVIADTVGTEFGPPRESDGDIAAPETEAPEEESNPLAKAFDEIAKVITG